MAITHGMDIATVRTIATRMDGQATAVGTVISQVDTLIQQAIDAWKGPDSAKFQSEWQSHYRPQLVTLRNELNQLAGRAKTNATNQEATSQQF